MPEIWVSGRCAKSFQVDSKRMEFGYSTIFKENIIKEKCKESDWLWVVHDLYPEHKRSTKSINNKTKSKVPWTYITCEPQIPNARLIPIDSKTSLLLLTLLVSMRPAMHILAVRSQLKLTNITWTIGGKDEQDNRSWLLYPAPVLSNLLTNICLTFWREDKTSRTSFQTPHDLPAKTFLNLRSSALVNSLIPWIYPTLTVKCRIVLVFAAESWLAAESLTTRQLLLSVDRHRHWADQSRHKLRFCG